MQSSKVVSWEQLQEIIADLLGRVNDRPDLARAAAVNPLFALEELGYRIDPAMRPVVEDRLRFDHRTAAERRKLRRQIVDLAGEEFDVDSEAQLRRILFDRLKIPPPTTHEQKGYRSGSPTEIDLKPPRPRVSWLETLPDPLEALSGRHAIIEPLLEFRRLGTLAPQLASRQAYDEVRSGKLKLPVTKIRGRLQREQPPPGKPPTPPTEPTSPTEPPPTKIFDLNTAGAAELIRIPGVGEKLAQRIVDYRLAFGRFESIESLKAVRGIGDDLLERMRPYLRVEG